MGDKMVECAIRLGNIVQNLDGIVETKVPEPVEDYLLKVFVLIDELLEETLKGLKIIESQMGGEK